MKDTHLTLRLPLVLARALAKWARDHGLPKSQVAREAVARYLSPPSATRESRRVTALDLAERWPGLPRLTPEEAAAFDADIVASRSVLPPIAPPWA
jgi:hypothetical protein